MANRINAALRVHLVAAGGLGLGLVALVSSRLALADLSALRSAGATASPEAVVTALAEVIGAVTAAWLAAGILATTTSVLLGLRVRIPFVPGALRRAVLAGLGVSVALAVAAPAGAATTSLDPGWTPDAAGSAPSRPAHRTPTPIPGSTNPAREGTHQGGTSGHRNGPTVPRTTPATHTGSATREGLTVRRGDTLWDIARRDLRAHGRPSDTTHVARAWPAWFAANRQIIGPDPDVLQPGAHLRPPA